MKECDRKKVSWHKIELNRELQTRRLLKEIEDIRKRVHKRKFNEAGKYKMYQGIENRYEAILFIKISPLYYNLTELRKMFKFGNIYNAVHKQ